MMAIFSKSEEIGEKSNILGVKKKEGKRREVPDIQI